MAAWGLTAARTTPSRSYQPREGECLSDFAAHGLSPFVWDCRHGRRHRSLSPVARRVGDRGDCPRTLGTRGANVRERTTVDGRKFPTSGIVSSSAAVTGPFGASAVRFVAKVAGGFRDVWSRLDGDQTGGLGHLAPTDVHSAFLATRCGIGASQPREAGREPPGEPMCEVCLEISRDATT